MDPVLLRVRVVEGGEAAGQPLAHVGRHPLGVVPEAEHGGADARRPVGQAAQQRGLHVRGPQLDQLAGRPGGRRQVVPQPDQEAVQELAAAGVAVLPERRHQPRDVVAEDEGLGRAEQVLHVEQQEPGRLQVAGVRVGPAAEDGLHRGPELAEDLGGQRGRLTGVPVGELQALDQEGPGQRRQHREHLHHDGAVHKVRAAGGQAGQAVEVDVVAPVLDEGVLEPRAERLLPEGGHGVALGRARARLPARLLQHHADDLGGGLVDGLLEAGRGPGPT